MTARRLLLVAAVLLSSCTTEVAEPHPLTAQEAERLALVRYLNYETRIAAVRATIPTAAGTLVLNGRVDFVDHVGHVAFQTKGRTDAASTGILQWNPALVAFRQGRGQRPEDPPATDGWQLRRLESAGSELDVVLLVLLNLANDRPDNPQLLRQSSAQWLRTDTVDGVAVDVFAGPAKADETARLTYWLDKENTLRRLTIRLSGQETDAVLSFSPSSVPLVPLPALTTH